MGALLLGFGLLLVGELLALGGEPTASRLLTQALGCVILAGCSRATVSYGVLKGVNSPTDRVRSAGPLSIIAVPTMAALLVDGPAGVVGAGSGLLAAGAIATSPTVRSRLTTIVPGLGERLPVVPALHVGLTVGTAGTLLAYLLLYTTLNVNVSGIVVATVTGVALSLVVLASVTDRRTARTHAILAATSTAALPGAVLIWDPPSVAVPEAASTLDSWMLVGVGVLVAGGWLFVWLALSDSGVSIATRFDQSGRKVSTERATVFTYFVLVSSGFLIAVVVGVGTTLAWLASRGKLPIPGMWMVVGALFATPLWLLLGGVVHQLRRAIKSILRFRNCPETDSLPSELPIEPRYPVCEINVDGFVATAYADPFTERIILSREAIEALSPAELAAVIAHEESHVEHRGALLQVIFSTVPLGAMMGRNVVFALYDFMERERTADDTAVERCREAGIDGMSSLTEALDTAQKMDSPGEAWVTFLPTAVTIPELLHPSSATERLYYTIFGSFAGQVHPPTFERKERLNGTQGGSDSE
jgi:Zn-dependent protease with chaperone function